MTHYQLRGHTAEGLFTASTPILLDSHHPPAEMASMNLIDDTYYQSDIDDRDEEDDDGPVIDWVEQRRLENECP